ncbi:hypothetical protein CY35_02G076600 [Sphagnum magellanicum]|nr:hypothetical protein CY35_02G076600 [Sphagnum magellanicum]
MGQQASFAAGCFWSVELAFQRVPGVIKSPRFQAFGGVVTGMESGQRQDGRPTYRQVCSGRTGHTEAVQLQYDPARVSYKQLLDVFWKKHDPTQVNRQGNDFHTLEQKEEAIASTKEHQSHPWKKIATKILAAGPFYMAEEYHQQYLQKGGGGGKQQSAAKMCTDPIRCYGLICRVKSLAHIVRSTSVTIVQLLTLVPKYIKENEVANQIP